MCIRDKSIGVQFDELINDIQEKNKCLENTNEIIKNNLNKLEPVSYTHLDVYKRQELCRCKTRFLYDDWG